MNKNRGAICFFLILFQSIVVGNQKIIVSFTTIDSRINDIKPVIDSILHQTLSPDSFELYISDHPTLFKGGIDNGIPPNKIPKFLRAYEQQDKLKIKYVDNLGPANKLIPCLQENWNTNNIIITIDDDTRYPKDFIELLVRAYEQNKCVVAFHGKSVLLEDGHLVPSYDAWRWIRKPSKDLYHFPLGQAGCLYTPQFFTELIFDKQTMFALAPTADDVWFYFMRLLTKTPAFILAKEWHVKDAVVGNKDTRLININCNRQMNDVYIKRMKELINALQISFQDSTRLSSSNININPDITMLC